MICKLVLQATIYELWRERNVRLHDSVSKSTECVIRDVQALMRQKLAGLDKNGCAAPWLSTTAMTDLTYLSLWFGYIQFMNHPAPWSIRIGETRLLYNDTNLNSNFSIPSPLLYYRLLYNALRLSNDNFYHFAIWSVRYSFPSIGLCLIKNFCNSENVSLLGK